MARAPGIMQGGIDNRAQFSQNLDDAFGPNGSMDKVIAATQQYQANQNQGINQAAQVTADLATAPGTAGGGPVALPEGSGGGAVAGMTDDAAGQTAIKAGTSDAKAALVEGGSSVWDLKPFERGRAIEQSLGMNLPSNFPVIDKFDWASGMATSIKSIDLTAATYQDAGALASKLNGYVDDVAAFNGKSWAGVNIDPSQVTSRQLQLAVQPGAMTAEQQAVINAATQRAQKMGVDLTVTPVK